MALDPNLRRALVGVAGMFFSHGVMIAVRAATVPLIKAQLGGDDRALALCLTAMGFGSLLSFAFANALVDRWGSAAAAVASVLVATVFFGAQPFIANAWIMAAALFCLGAGVAMSDMAMNVQASIVEQHAGTSLMTRIHGCWSMGAITGSVLAGLLIERLPLPAFALGFSLLSALAAYACARPFLKQDARQEGTGRRFFEPPAIALLPIALMAFLALLVVVGVRDWVPLYLLEDLGSSLSLSVQAFAAFQATTALGRFFGDSIRAGMGDRRLLVIGGTTGAVALAAGIASRDATGMFICLAVLGLAHANIFPVLVSIAGRHDPGSESRNVSAVMGLGSGGFIAGPILIGALAQGLGLTVGLAAIAGVSLAIAALALQAGNLSRRR